VTERPKVGDWYAFCCEEDLKQIETEDELTEALEENAEWLDEFDWPFYRFFTTREDAVAYFGNCGK